MYDISQCCSVDDESSQIAPISSQGDLDYQPSLRSSKMVKINFYCTSNEDIMIVLKYAKTSTGKWKTASALMNRLGCIFPASMPNETPSDSFRLLQNLLTRKNRRLRKYRQIHYIVRMELKIVLFVKKWIQDIHLLIGAFRANHVIQ